MLHYENFTLYFANLALLLVGGGFEATGGFREVLIPSDFFVVVDPNVDPFVLLATVVFLVVVALPST